MAATEVWERAFWSTTQPSGATVAVSLRIRKSSCTTPSGGSSTFSSGTAGSTGETSRSGLRAFPAAFSAAGSDAAPGFPFGSSTGRPSSSTGTPSRVTAQPSLWAIPASTLICSSVRSDQATSSRGPTYTVERGSTPSTGSAVAGLSTRPCTRSSTCLAGTIGSRVVDRADWRLPLEGEPSGWSICMGVLRGGVTWPGRRRSGLARSGTGEWRTAGARPRRRCRPA